MEKDTVILIGGAPTVGKTTIAEKLSKKFGVPWFPTDGIRGFMRPLVRKEDYPELFVIEGYTAEEFLNKFTSQQIVDWQNRESIDVWQGVKAFMKTADINWGSYIIEGVAILPELVSRDLADKKNVKSMFLIDEDANKVRDVVFNRGLWDDAQTYSDKVKEKEVEWALLYSQWLKAEAKKFKFPVLEVVKDKTDIEQICKILEL